MLRKIALAALALVLACPPMTGTTPTTGTLLGFLARDTVTGAAVSGPANVTVHIYDSANAIVPLWEETTEVTFASGFGGLELGNANPIPPNLADSPGLYMGITIGAGPEMTPRLTLTPLSITDNPIPLDLLSFSRSTPSGDITVAFRPMDGMSSTFNGGTISCTVKDAGDSVLHTQPAVAGSAGGDYDLIATLPGVPTGVSRQAAKRTLTFGMAISQDAVPIATGLGFPLPVTWSSAATCAELLYLLPAGSTPPSSPGGTFGCTGVPDGPGGLANLSLSKASVLNAVAEGGDRATVKAAFTRSGEAGPSFDPAAEGMTLRIGNPEDPLVIEIPAEDAGWKTSSGGTAWKWKSPPQDRPAVSLTLNAGKGSLVLGLSGFDFPSAPGQALLLSMEIGDDAVETGADCDAKLTYSGGPR